MTAVKKTLLAIVQDILSDLDSEPVNSLSDTLEAEQVASVVEHTFYDLIVEFNIPEHEGLIKLTALSDTDFPTHFSYPDNVNSIDCVWYDVSTDNSFEYREIPFVEPLEFLQRTDSISSNYDSVEDKLAGTNLRIVNNKMPSFYTSFDDEYIVMDSYDSSEENTLQESKSRAYGGTYPVFSRVGTYTPDIDAEYFPYLIREATARCQDLFKGGATPKIEQASRHAKAYVQSKLHRTTRENKWSNYGRS